MNLVVIHPEAVRERRENADLVLRVVAVNVQVRRRLGVAMLLRVGEHGGEIRALGLHARQNVIAGAVDDAIDARGMRLPTNPSRSDLMMGMPPQTLAS